MPLNVTKPKVLIIEDPAISEFSALFDTVRDLMHLRCVRLGQDAHTLLRECEFDFIFTDMSHESFDVKDISRHSIALSCAAPNAIKIVVISKLYLSYVGKLRNLDITEVVASPLHLNDVTMLMINYFPSLKETLSRKNSLLDSMQVINL